MAISAACVWEVRTAGSDSNGGGFVTGASGSDFSQQNAQQATLTTASVVHSTTTQLNVSAGDYTVTTNDVGNIFQLVGGSATAGFYQITAVDVGNNRWTVDRSLGTAGQTCPGRMGGALATPGKASGAATVSQQLIYVKSGTYTISSATQQIANGCVLMNNGVYMEGYDATRGDLGTPPLFQASGITNFTLVSNGNTTVDQWIVNISVDGISATGSAGFSVEGVIYKCKAVNCKAGAFASNGSRATCVRCEASGCATINCFVNLNCYECYAHDNTVTGFELSSTAGIVVSRCISESNSGASSSGFTFDSTRGTAINCVAYNNGLDGFRINDGKNTLINCIAESNAGIGFRGTIGTDGAIWLNNCAVFSNTGGNVSLGTGRTRNIGQVTGTASFFTNAASGDFSLNNTASAGASARAAGIPGEFPNGTTTGYVDIGAAQHQDTGGGGGGGSFVF